MKILKVIMPAVAISFAQPALSHQEPTREQLDAMAKAGLEIDPAYEMQAMPAYFGDGAIMRECASLGAPVAVPFSLYLSVSPTGAIEYQRAYPVTVVAQCMIRESSTRTLPVPAKPLVLKIDMKFTE